MDKVDEVKKLKQLLDEGIINEEDFQKKKSQVLGFSEEVVEKEDINDTKSKTLEEYEKKLIEQSEIIEEAQINSSDDFYEKEKIKVKAKLDAEEENRSRRREEQKAVVNKKIEKIKRTSKWALAVFLWIFGIASFYTVESGIVYIPLGIVTIILGCMACPKITEITQKYETYTMHKKGIVWIMVIILIIICTTGSSNTTSQENVKNQNQTSINNQVNK